MQSSLSRKVLLVLKNVPQWRRSLYIELAKQLRKMGYQLLILYDFSASTFSNHKSSGDIDCINTQNLKLKKFLSIFDYLKGFKTILEKYNPDIVISDANTRFLSNITIFKHKKSLGFRHYGWTSGYFKKNNFILMKYRRYFLKNFDYLFLYHKKAYEVLKKKYSCSNLSVIGNAVDFSDISHVKRLFSIKELDKLRALFVEKNRKIALFVGKLTKSKKVDLIINAAELLEDKYIFIIVGSGPEKFNLIKLKTVKNLDNLIFISSFNRGVDLLFKLSDVFIMPGTGGLALIQSILNKTPVITSHGDGIAEELVINGYNGFISDSFNVNFLIESLQKIYYLNLGDNIKTDDYVEYTPFNVAQKIVDKIKKDVK